MDYKKKYLKYKLKYLTAKKIYGGFWPFTKGEDERKKREAEEVKQRDNETTEQWKARIRNEVLERRAAKLTRLWNDRIIDPATGREVQDQDLLNMFIRLEAKRKYSLF
tara:strand:- start:72 stop:395 length:324 start_codon:yes stop_codon:yes gene_type:complete